jgi:hypothetical protein
VGDKELFKGAPLVIYFQLDPYFLTSPPLPVTLPGGTKPSTQEFLRDI